MRSILMTSGSSNVVLPGTLQNIVWEDHLLWSRQSRLTREQLKINSKEYLPFLQCMARTDD